MACKPPGRTTELVFIWLSGEKEKWSLKVTHYERRWTCGIVFIIKCVDFVLIILLSVMFIFYQMNIFQVIFVRYLIVLENGCVSMVCSELLMCAVIIHSVKWKWWKVTGNPSLLSWKMQVWVCVCVCRKTIHEWTLVLKRKRQDLFLRVEKCGLQCHVLLCGHWVHSAATAYFNHSYDF